MRRVFHLSWVILLLALAPAYAEIYKWVDRDGRVHFLIRLPVFHPSIATASRKRWALRQHHAATLRHSG